MIYPNWGSYTTFLFPFLGFLAHAFRVFVKILEILWGFMENRVREIRTKRGLTQQDLTALLGCAPSYIGKIERGEIKLSSKNMPAIAEALGVMPQELISNAEPQGIPILGDVKAGTWDAVDDIGQAEPKRLPFSHAPNHPNLKQFALTVQGDSMDKRFHEGEILICVELADWGRNPEVGDLVIAERIMKGHLREATVKRLSKEGEDMVLMPESTNPAHKPINLNKSEEDIEVSIIGIVVGSYNPNP